MSEPKARAAESGRQGELHVTVTSSPRSEPVRAVPIGSRTVVALALASVVGLVAFAWPFFVTDGSRLDGSDSAPLVFGALLLLVVLIVFAQVADGGFDAKALALLGVLSALGAALRPLGAGTAGVETVFFVIILAGRALGPGFGYSLGCTTLFASALVTGGVGPWLPYQMFGCAWVGLGAGLLPRASGRREIALLAAYGGIAAFLYGFLLNLSFWPFALGDDTALSFVPGDTVVENLHRYVLFDATTSLGWDTGRAVTNVLLILVAGRPVLSALRRASRRASFAAPVRFAPAAAKSTPEPIT
jgi:energy-coupling factor transport system substrate-specific component